MDSYEKEFESAGQGSQASCYCIKTFYGSSGSCMERKYQHYLSLRFRPAISD